MYSYTGGSLSRVTRPDDLYWEFELQPQKAFQKGYFCTDYPLPTGAQSTYARTSTVRHPNGTLGSFELGLIKNGRNNVPDHISDNANHNDGIDCKDYESASANVGLALKSKTLTLSGGTDEDTDYVWSYWYEQDNGYRNHPDGPAS